MTRFVVLLGGDLTATRRLKSQIQKARIIAADGGMAHAETLGLTPELWVGDFDSTPDDLAERHKSVPRHAFPAEKDKTDGEIAVDEAMRLGAREIVMVGGLGGQADHALAHLGLILRLGRRRVAAFITSGEEEAYPILNGTHHFDVPRGSRFSVVPFTDLAGLDLEGVKWPLTNRSVPLGSSLTVSNVAMGPVTVKLSQGYAVALSYPESKM
jgi:thiamine pyrophosphokinase